MLIIPARVARSSEQKLPRRPGGNAEIRPPHGAGSSRAHLQLTPALGVSPRCVNRTFIPRMRVVPFHPSTRVVRDCRLAASARNGT